MSLKTEDSAFVIVLAFPETIVRVADEWYSKFLPYVGIGRKGYVRAGHAAMVVISKENPRLEYFDFGRYITPEPYGRVRSEDTDHELRFDLKPVIQNNQIVNLQDILKFMGSKPELTHGDGSLVASVTSKVNYSRIKNYINREQDRGFIRYAAFKKDATNCVRFVTDALIAGINDKMIRDNLSRSKWFTPSSISNVINANTETQIYKVEASSELSEFKSSRLATNASLFFDRLKKEPLNGQMSNSNSKEIKGAQWLSGIGSGAWFRLEDLGQDLVYGFKRIAPCGRVDVHGQYKLAETGFCIKSPYSFMYNSNCSFFHIKQGEKVFRFDLLRD